jgi:hypothetical protein
MTVADFIDRHYVPRYYQAETIADIKSPDGRSKVKLLRRDLGDLRLKQLESEVVVDDYKKQLMAKGRVAGCNRKLSKLRQMLNWARDWKFISTVPFNGPAGAVNVRQHKNVGIIGRRILFVSQRHHGIHTRGPSRGKIAGQQRDQNKEHGDG